VTTATATAPAIRRRPKAPGTLYTVILGIAVVVLAAQLLSAPRDSPPAIAEIAPQAVEQIKTPPPEQATNLGKADGIGEGGAGGGGGGGGPSTTTTTAAPTTTVPQKPVPRVLRCVGTPPRQIEDPQSPPCVPYWEGDNGGATWRGVTKDEITIVVPSVQYAKSAPFEAFFNQRFQFYGRHLKFVDYAGQGNSCEASVQQQMAVDVANKAKAFASAWQWPCFAYYYGDELARQGVIYSTTTPNYSEKALADRAPWIWQYPMETDRLFATTGKWACARLVPGVARFAKDPTLLNQPRKFGVLLGRPQFSPEHAKLDAILNELRKCGADVVYTDSAESSFDQSNHVLQLKQRGATTVVCLCEPFEFSAITNTAQSNGYAPEWVIGTYREMDNNWNMQIANKAAAVSLMGVSVKPRQSNIENEPAYWAISETNPSYGTGTSKPTAADVKDLNETYRSLLLLASGIQMAGPNLTPKTFAEGLQRTVFPNPDSPIQAGKVGFQGGSHSMTLDANEFWWSNTDPGPYADKGDGTLCYIENGKRHTENDWPHGDADFFKAPCMAGG
jgi:hypothetical protein